MKNKEPKDMTCNKMAWTDRNFSTLIFNIRYYSEVFTARHYAWRLVIYRGNMDNNMSLAIYLKAADASSLPHGFSIWTPYSVTVTDQISTKNCRTCGAFQVGFLVIGLLFGYLVIGFKKGAPHRVTQRAVKKPLAALLQLCIVHTMKNKEPKDMTCKKMAWTVKNFSTLIFNIRYYSEVFSAGHCTWRLLTYRRRIDNNMTLAIGLEAADASSLPQGCCIWTAYSLTVTNQISRKNSRTKGDADKPFKFSANKTKWAYGSVMPLHELQWPYILNDTCIIEVEFFSVTFEGFEPTIHPKDDFKDLGKIEKSFIPLLEEVCSRHPSLLDCTKNKSRRFNKCALTALGRVLQFLKNKKWKDMNEEACQQLQHLWEELEMIRLDLGWLEPLVKSALNMKGYDEKIEKVKKLKQNLVVAETKMNMIEEKLAHTEQNVEMVRKELVSVEEDFEEKDLDANIGYMPKLDVDNVAN